MFFEFSFQESLRDSGFGGYAAGGQLVDVVGFVFAFAEVAGFYPASFYQGLEAIVCLAQADAELAREGALAQVWVGFQGSEEG